VGRALLKDVFGSDTRLGRLVDYAPKSVAKLSK
jgi:hypothetical protein